MSTDKDAQHDEHRPNVGLYIKVFAALMVLTVITVAISKLHLAKTAAISLGLFVALIKASLVGALFMHLWGENKLVHRTLWLTVGGAAILILPLLDIVMISGRVTSPADVSSQHPGGEHAGEKDPGLHDHEAPGEKKGGH